MRTASHQGPSPRGQRIFGLRRRHDHCTGVLQFFGQLAGRPQPCQPAPGAKSWKPYLPAIRGRWPRQTAAITAQLEALNALEKAGSHDLDALCRAFGDLLGAVFAFREDIWSPTLQAMGRGLGGFIYLMDAYDDLPKDARKGQFNALQELHDTLPPTEFEDRCHDLLTQQMGLCAQQFELLPILKETPEGKLLYNTIYSGVWSKYAPIRKHREGKQK